MIKRRKLMINDMEVTIENDDNNAEILEYIDSNESYITEEQQQQLLSGEQFMMEDGTIIQCIDPEYATDDTVESTEDLNQTEVFVSDQEPKPYTIINGEREGSLLLYSDRQLYKKNRSKYYRCRLFPACNASGRVIGNLFHLLHPHVDHPDQEDYKESLKLYNTLRGKSKENETNFDVIYDEECAKQESTVVVNETKNKSLSPKVQKRSINAFKLLADILSNCDETPVDNNDERPLNNFMKNEIISIEDLGIRSKVIFSAGHIYVHASTSTYRCYLYPKCVAVGNLIKEGNVSFQLVKPHINHGFKDKEKDILLFISTVKKRVQNNLSNLSQIFNEELNKECNQHIKNNISLETFIKFLNQSFPSEEKKNDSEDVHLRTPREFTVIDGGASGHILFCDGQLYNANSRAGYYRCRLYQSGCPATGVRGKNHFILMRAHVGHGNQIIEKTKLLLTSALRRRAATETLPLQVIYNQEMRNPEFKAISTILPYHSVYKIMKRARVLGLNTEKSTENTEEEKAVPESPQKSNSPVNPTERVKQVKNPQFPCMKYTLMEGERLGSCILYCNEQLYTLNRNNYYRCRMYPQGCQATGMREENYFRLCRGHSGHGSQEPERRRIILINTIKKKTMTNPDPDYFESVFNRECERPEYADIVERVSFTVILNNMRKIWKRFQQQDPTLSRNIMRNDMPEDLHQKMTERETKEKDPLLDQEENDDLRMAVEVGDDVYCDQDTSPKPFTFMEGERLGSCLLYSNQQLYTNNQKNYYRCRMYAIGCRATGIIKENLFFLLKPHNSHGSQEREVRRLILITRIKRRAQIDPTRLQKIFNEECNKPEFVDVADMINFKKIYSTLDRCRRRAASDVLEVVEPKIPPGIPILSETNNESEWNENLEENSENTQMETDNFFIENEDYSQQNKENDAIDEEDDQPRETENVATTQEMSQEELINQLGLADSGDENIYDENVNEVESHLEESSLVVDNFEAEGENYIFIGGDRFGSKLLYSEGQLYCLNRDNYFRCRVYPNCIATGRIYGNCFRLHRGHSTHPLQEDEKNRLLFMTKLKERVQSELSASIKEIFDEECAKPEYETIASTINYKAIFSTLMKCRTRAQTISEKTNGDSLDEQLETILQDVTKSSGDIQNETEEEELLKPTWDLDECSGSDMDDFVEVPKPDMNTPTKYTIIQGDRTGSLILYSNGHLYTRNRGSYYRCRLHPACYGSGNRRGNLFYMTRQHSNHPLQDDEKCRLTLMNILKKRVLQESTPLKVIYDEEIVKPEFAPIADLVSFKMIQSTMIKIRERVRYGQEPGTVMLSTDSVPLSGKLDNIEETENLENDEVPESDPEDSVQDKKTTRNERADDRYVYYYILDYSDTEVENESLHLNLDENISREYYNTPNLNLRPSEHPAMQPIVTYVVDIDNQENTPLFKRQVHLPDESLNTDSNTEKNKISKQVEVQEPIDYKIIEDCLNDQLLLYAGKQLYVKRKNSFYGCRIKSCHAIGQIKNGSFYLLYNHNNHPLQNKVKLQLQLIARIKARCLERRTARVSKIFREECTKHEFRSVANTVTLDGISEMVRKHRRKMFPKMTNPPTEIMSGSSLLEELPPPVEFSMVNGTTPDVRLLHCDNALFYHASKGVYRCHVKGCPSFGRRDRIFFQLLSPHSEHETVDINDKEKLLELIKQTEENILKQKLSGDSEVVNDEICDTPTKSLDNELPVHQIKFEVHSEDTADGENTVILENEVREENFESSSNHSNTKSILQQAWEELQVHI